MVGTEGSSRFGDLVCYVILFAPDRFSPRSGMNLDSAFERLHLELRQLESKIGATMTSKFETLLKSAYSNYLNGHMKEAIQDMQEIDFDLNPSSRL